MQKTAEIYIEPASLRKIFQTLGSMYLIWIGISLFVFHTGHLLPLDRESQHLLSPFSLLFFLCLASGLTAMFMIYAEPLLRPHHRLRKALLLLCTAISAGLFAFARVSGSIHPLIYIAGTANLLVFASLLGSWIVAPLKRPAELLPLCLVMALVDIFSVAGGPTKKIAETLEKYYRSGMKGPAPAGDFILFKIPVPGLENLVPLFGLADWIIIAFLAAYSAKFSISDNITGRSLNRMKENRRLSFYLPVPVMGLIAGIFLARFLGIFLPALPIIVVFFLGYIMTKYPEARNLTHSDRKLMLITLAAMAGLVAVRFFLFQ
ncbi:MAG: hypothetical protein AB7S75_00270 [Desulfococcaceae bacterium]